MADETQAAPAQPEKSPREKLDEAYKAYWKAVKAGDRAGAAKIHADNKLTLHPSHHESLS